MSTACTNTSPKTSLLDQILPAFLVDYLAKRRRRQARNIFNGVQYRDLGNGVPEIDASELNIPESELGWEDAIPPNDQAAD